MKNNKLIALALVFFIFMAWYRVLLVPAEEMNEIKDLKTQAETYAEDGAPEVAVRLLQKVLKIKDTLENREEMYSYIRSCVEEGSIEFGKNDIQSFVNDTMEQYADESFSYEIAMEYFAGEQNYTKCADIMKTAILNNAVSDVVQSLYDSVKYDYRVNHDKYGDVMNYSDGIYPVLGGRGWSFCDSELIPLFQDEFDCVTICNDGYIAAEKDGYVKIYNANGQVQNAFAIGDMNLSGAVGNDKVLMSRNDKYFYVSTSGDIVSEEYDMAGIYEDGITAVKVGNEWMVLNKNGETLLSSLERVVLDEDGKCMKSDCLVAVKSGSFFGYDKKGNELCKFDVEDMKAFGDGSYAAACRSGKWGFVDLSGNWILDPIYDDARSFCNGFAAVCVESKWGYIDEKGDLVVECIFDDAKDFTEDKKSLVNQNGIWNSLEMLCK